MASNTDLASYACDSCRSRKVSCSRLQPVCTRCSNEAIECHYSRIGIIRRKRKRRDEHASGTTSAHATPSSVASIDRAATGPPVDATAVQSHLVNDIEATRSLLTDADALRDTSLGALSSLSEACAKVWHNTLEFDQSSKGYFLFEDRAESWVEAFVTTLGRGHPILACEPSDEVLSNLRACRPHLVRERAWLVMYYSVILSMVSSTTPEDTSTKEKLRCNLWLAVNDVRILLEPSEPNIQALALLATHVEEFTSPSLCWMLIANACRMLQAIGINLRHLSPETRRRRTMTFWYLNLVDKGLSVIFGRPPTFHRAMSREMPVPTVAQLLPYQPHNQARSDNGSRPGSLFGAHFIHQIMLLSHVIGDIWTCVYEDTSSDERAVEAARQDLESWYATAKPLLKASATAERALLDDKGAASVDLGLYTLEFNRHYLLVTLGRASGNMKSETMYSSKKMLYLLKHLVSDSEEVYNGIVWQLVCCPFTPFLALFGDLLANREACHAERLEALAAMRELPVFLKKMGLRNSLARKLEAVAATIVHHADSVVNATSDHTFTSTSHMAHDAWPAIDDFDWDSFMHSLSSDQAGEQPTGEEHETAPWTDVFLGDINIDWIGLGDTLLV